MRSKADEDSRALVRDAREAAGDVLREGTELSNNLREMGESLRRNSDRLLRDVKAAHRELTKRLDRTAGPERPARTPAPVQEVDLDVPEFAPRARRAGR
jgi:hypothetical protein